MALDKKKNALIPCKTCGKEIAKNAKLCPHCGGKNKKSMKQQLWWRIPLSILVAYTLFGGFSEDAPTCVNDAGKNAAIKVFAEESPSSIPNLKIITLSNTKEISFEDKSGIRKCTGKALLNSGEETQVHFEFRPTAEGTIVRVDVNE